MSWGILPETFQEDKNEDWEKHQHKTDLSLSGLLGNFKLFSYVIRKMSQELDKIPFMYLQGPFLHYRQRECYLKKKKRVFR